MLEELWSLLQSIQWYTLQAPFFCNITCSIDGELQLYQWKSFRNRSVIRNWLRFTLNDIDGKAVIDVIQCGEKDRIVYSSETLVQ